MTIKVGATDAPATNIYDDDIFKDIDEIFKSEQITPTMSMSDAPIINEIAEERLRVLSRESHQSGQLLQRVINGYNTNTEMKIVDEEET